VKTTIGGQLQQQNILEVKTNGVEEDINNHGSGNKWMPLRMV
jgi:hypothetical protein